MLDITGYEDRVPAHTLAALERYVERKYMPGGFLTSVLCNDLFGAVCRADLENLPALPAICEFVYNRMPSESWGSQEKMWKYVEDTFYKSLDKSKKR